jgi:hypothetical protein
MSGGSKNQTTTTQSNQPATWAKPGLTWAGGQATDLAKAGQLAQPLGMSTVVPFSQQTQQGMGDIQHRANVWQAPMDRNYERVQANAAQGGLNGLQAQSVEQLQGLVGGQYDQNANPGFAGVLKQAQDAASNAVNQNAASMGRYSGGAHQGVLAHEVGDLTSRMVNDDFNRYLGRKDNATSALFNAGQTQQNNINGAAGALSDAYGAAMMPVESRMAVGGMNEDLYGRQLNDNLRIASETQNQPANNLKELMALLGGSGQFGTTTQTAQGPNSTMSNIFGGLLGGASLLGL